MEARRPGLSGHFRKPAQADLWMQSRKDRHAGGRRLHDADWLADGTDAAAVETDAGAVRPGASGEGGESVDGGRCGKRRSPGNDNMAHLLLLIGMEEADARAASTPAKDPTRIARVLHRRARLRSTTWAAQARSIR